MSYITDFPTFRPTSFPGCVLWLRADTGVTYVMSAVVATGTSPPAVTLTGAPNTTVINTNPATPAIEIDITTGGIGSAALFTWKLNGVTQQTGQSATSTFILGTTGLTVNFPNSTYTDDNVYTSSTNASAWKDLSGFGNHATQATNANQPIYTIQTHGNGYPSLNVASPQFMTIPNAASLQIMGPITVVGVLRSTNISAYNTVISKGVGGEFDLFFQTGENNAARSSVYQMRVNSSPTVNVTHSLVWTTDQSSFQQAYVDGVSQTLSVNLFGAGTTSTHPVYIGQRSDAVTQLVGEMFEFMIYNQFLNSTQLTQLHTYQKLFWNIT